ncbi:hypothetical protein GCM10010873_12110 [Cypionkella aquatica]|uniref:Uncharacterized protein n=1 Tax=Cypionkella aquatica TaxID=1756042 RepID=A0AA37WZI0_9RHOB|nr:hypothetical protein [Cypionkella aquatica]GLS86237.1 hypothetical protein GCM10010873_12110 [Cypionkella aquatica]
MTQKLTFYLDDDKRSRAEAGTGIFGAIVAVVQAAGWKVRYLGQNDGIAGDGFHLVYNRAVEGPFCFSLRRCYLDKYYRIEATNDRWDWDVAGLTFPGKPGAAWFQRYWRERLFRGLGIANNGYIFMPLQGKLLQRRHFQAASPIDMIKATLAADPVRRIVATLHPQEVYTASELQALHGIARFELAEGSLPWLAGCDYVVTENSSLALTGFFANKPAVLFGRIDFHHIAASVGRLGVAAALEAVAQPQPFADYLFWFFKKQALCAVGDDVALRLAERLRAHGWPL